uniref:Large ribosomal subunit protein uL3c n=1 Tax=Gronococcus sybilensis TaxID=3028029 RepID=A0A9Y1MX46_9RHOD|nr:ribosomal protein L3 [Gronococcus sybilensis]
MSTGILGTKIGMTQIFDETGTAIPVSVIEAGPCPIISVKSMLRHGYEAIQIGYLASPPKKVNKPFGGHFYKNNMTPMKYLKEYKTNQSENYDIGVYITVENFYKNQLVNVSGITIGKGFAGHQKRHNFSRGPKTHGSRNYKSPGSIGAGTNPARVLPKTRMAGHYGAKKTSIRKLKVIQVDAKSNILLIKGSIPGKPGSIVSITPS